MKKGLIVVILVAIGGGLLMHSNQEETRNSAGVIKIGAVISLTGPAASFGEYAKNGMELAVNEINEDGGIKGKMVELVIEDDKTDPKDAASAFNKLISVDDVSGVVGGLWDFIAQPIFPLALQNEVTLISPSNLRIEGEFEPNDQSFLMLTEFKNVLAKGKEYLEREDVKKVAVVHFKSAFGEEVARAFNEMVNDLGKGPMINESYTNRGSNDFRTTIAKLKQQRVDTVFLDMVDIDTVNFLKAAQELNFAPKFITYVGSYDAFTEENKYLLEGITVIDWEFAQEDFSKKYKAFYGSEPAKSAQRAYDAVYILAEAIANTNSRSEVADYIESHTFKTSNGVTSFLPTHEVSKTDVELRVYKNGTLVPYEN